MLLFLCISNNNKNDYCYLLLPQKIDIISIEQSFSTTRTLINDRSIGRSVKKIDNGGVQKSKSSDSQNKNKNRIPPGLPL